MQESNRNNWIDKDGISGPLVEDVFFADSRKQLENIWGLNNLEDFSSLPEIYLPNSLITFINSKVIDTENDGKERSASIGWGNKTVQVFDEEVGKDSIYDYLDSDRFNSIGASVAPLSLLKYSWSRLFSKPVPIFFHTHPTFNQVDLKSFNLHFPNNESLKVSGDDFVKFFDFMSNTFSENDLKTYSQSHRYLNSMLLASSQRIVYIAPKSLTLKYGFSKLVLDYRNYGKRFEALTLASMLYYFRLPISVFDPKKFKTSRRDMEIYNKAKSLTESGLSLKTLEDYRNKILIDFCKSTNNIAFASDSLNNKVLQRLD